MLKKKQILTVIKICFFKKIRNIIIIFILVFPNWKKICFFLSYPLCLGNISKDFTANNIKTTELNNYAYDFFVDYNIIDNSNIINIDKYLMKKHGIMIGFLKIIFIRLWSDWTMESFGTSLISNLKCVFLNNQSCKARPTIVNVNSDKTLFSPMLTILGEVVARIMIPMLEFSFQIK